MILIRIMNIKVRIPYTRWARQNRAQVGTESELKGANLTIELHRRWKILPEEEKMEWRRRPWTWSAAGEVNMREFFEEETWKSRLSFLIEGVNGNRQKRLIGVREVVKHLSQPEGKLFINRYPRFSRAVKDKLLDFYDEGIEESDIWCEEIFGLHITDIK